MNIKPIRTDDLRAAFIRLERVYQAKEGTPAVDEMEILVMLTEAYEHKHFPIGLVNPVEAIKFRMEQQGLTKSDIIVQSHSSAYYSAHLEQPHREDEPCPA